MSPLPAEPQDASPYLSVVVTSRNDGHGGDPLARLQAFVNTFDAQCRRFGLDAEVVVVEWNPPADRTRLHEVVTAPPGCAFALRFIEVPAALHNGLPHPHVLPLFQMIGKNVGIRRSRGEFVLCTNIDIIFSNELVQFFASRALQHGVMYRVDRHDIESAYPSDAPLDDQLAYCASHHLRVHRGSGTFPVDRDGRLVPLTPDVFDPPAVTIGDGWHMREGHRSQGFYRWATSRSSLLVAADAVESPALALDIEPNPYDPGSWVALELTCDGVTIGRARIDDRRSLRVPLPDGRQVREVVLRTVDLSPGSEQLMPAFERRRDLDYRVRSARLAQLPSAVTRRSAPYDPAGWRKAHRDAAIEATAAGLVVRSAPAQHTYAARYGPLYAPRTDRYTFVMDCTCVAGNVSLHLVDEEADRFVPADEFETADAGRRQLAVSAPLTRGQSFSLYVANRHRGGDGISVLTIHSISGSEPLTVLQWHLDRFALAGAIRRLSMKAVRSASRRAARAFPTGSLDRGATNEATSSDPVTPSQTSNASGDPGLTGRIEAYAQQHRLPPVHRNAAGDFQLMARRHWFELHGYAQFTMYSMNVDGLMDDVAHHAGIREEVLSMPRCIYHLEHEQGSGWTPEGEGLLRKRLSESGADWLDAATVDLWSAYMGWLKRPMLFNGPDWGFGDTVLPEVTIATARNRVDA
jgi:hypothetical protein